MVDNPEITPTPLQGDQQRQRLAIAWGAGLFLGIGIGGALGFALRDWLFGLIVAVVITLAVAVFYLRAGFNHAERRAAGIVARHERDDEDEDDDGTY